MKKQPAKLTGNALFEFAVKSLSRRAQSSSELRSKLKIRALHDSDVEPVLERLREYGYLDDRRFAESFAAARKDNQGFGRSRTLHDLRARRVSPKAAESAVNAAYEGVDEMAQIEEYIRRKYRAAPRETLFAEDKDLAAAYRRLLRAGFRGGNIVRALKRFAKNPDLLDAIEPEEPSDQAL